MNEECGSMSIDLKVLISIKGKQFELTENEARQLLAELEKRFAKDVVIPAYPPITPWYPQPQPWQPWTTWGTGTDPSPRGHPIY